MPGSQSIISSRRDARESATSPGRSGSTPFSCARSGYQQSLAAAKIAFDPALYVNGPWSESWGRDAIGQLFDRKAAQPDALFCDNDQLARGAAEALRDRGIVVPADVAIVGFDNWEVMTDAARPQLTSVDMNLRTLGREAGEALLRIIQGEKLRGVRRLPCSLVVRESSAVPKIS